MNKASAAGPSLPRSRRKFLHRALHVGAALGAAAVLPAACIGGGRQRLQVAVLGAGYSGLAAARHLQRHGLDAVVLESSERFGGRAYSVQQGEEHYNLGASEIGNGYKRFLNLAEEHAVALVSPPASEPGTCLSVGGKLLAPAAWPSSEVNHLPKSLRAIAPPQLLYSLHLKDFPLSNLTDWFQPEFSHLDVPESDYLRHFGANDEALRLIDRAGNFNHIDNISALHVLRALAAYRHGGSTATLRVDGGTDRVAKALAGSLQPAPLTGKRAIALRMVGTGKSGGVEIDCEDGSAYLADKVLVTLPFSVLRTLRLDLPIPQKQRRAINHLPYTHISQYHYQVKRPFWEEDGLPANIWTDTPIERGFLLRRADGSVRNYIVWINSPTAFDQIHPQRAAHWILRQMEALRPASKGALQSQMQYSWTRNPNSLGAYAHFAPGQVTEFAHRLAEPVAGRVFFAGEHTARLATGVEGALESAARVAEQMLA